MGADPGVERKHYTHSQMDRQVGLHHRILVRRRERERESGREREREIERDFFLFFESASGRFEPATPA